MLTRNCATDLFEKGDLNVRVTLFDRNPKYFLPDAYKSAWVETIYESVGAGIYLSGTENTFLVRKAGNKKPYTFNGTFTGLIYKIQTAFNKPSSIRITLLGESNRTWIILIPKF